jgi:hypothetical protein
MFIRSIMIIKGGHIRHDSALSTPIFQYIRLDGVLSSSLTKEEWKSERKSCPPHFHPHPRHPFPDVFLKLANGNGRRGISRTLTLPAGRLWCLWWRKPYIDLVIDTNIFFLSDEPSFLVGVLLASEEMTYSVTC